MVDRCREQDLDFGRVVILICMDINFPEVWHEAYALGAEIVIWPTTMTTPNFDAQSYARLHRYSILAGGRPGDIVDVLGHSLNSAQVCNNATSPAAAGFCILDGVVDLDRVFLHECCGTCAPLLAALTKYPELELELHGCGYRYGTPDAVGYVTEQAVMLLRSTQPQNVSAREVMREAGVLPLREILSLSRQGLNSLRQHGLPIPNATASAAPLKTSDPAAPLPPQRNPASWIEWRAHLNFCMTNLCWNGSQVCADEQTHEYLKAWNGSASAKVFADYIQSLNVDSMLLEAMPSGGGWATFPSEFAPIFPQLAARGHDWFGELTAELDSRGIAVFAYMNIAFNFREIKRRPEWTWLDYNGSDWKINGTADAPDGMRHMCLNAPGYIDLYANITSELIRKYKVQSAYLDLCTLAFVP